MFFMNQQQVLLQPLIALSVSMRAKRTRTRSDNGWRVSKKDQVLKVRKYGKQIMVSSILPKKMNIGIIFSTWNYPNVRFLEDLRTLTFSWIRKKAELLKWAPSLLGLENSYQMMNAACLASAEMVPDLIWGLAFVPKNLGPKKDRGPNEVRDHFRCSRKNA